LVLRIKTPNNLIFLLPFEVFPWLLPWPFLLPPPAFCSTLRGSPCSNCKFSSPRQTFLRLPHTVLVSRAHSHNCLSHNFRASPVLLSFQPINGKGQIHCRYQDFSVLQAAYCL